MCVRCHPKLGEANLFPVPSSRRILRQTQDDNAQGAHKL
jgi:hypothetical protein